MRSSLPRRSFVLRRRALRVERRVAVRPLVDRDVALGLERVRVVTGRQVEVALRVEVDLAADVAADAAVDRHVDDLLLGVEVELALRELEAREAQRALELVPVGLRALERGVALVGDRRGGIVLRRVAGGRVVEVDPVVALEVRVDRDALEALLVVRVDVDLRGERVDLRLRIEQPHLARARRVQHAPVGQHRQADRLARPVVERDLLELLRRRRAAALRTGGGGQRAERHDHARGDESPHSCPTSLGAASTLVGLPAAEAHPGPGRGAPAGRGSRSFRRRPTLRH